MKALLSRKSIIAIGILFFTIFIICLTLINFNFNINNIENYTSSPNSDLVQSSDNDISLFSAPNNADAYIEYTEYDAMNSIKGIIYRRSNGKNSTIISQQQVAEGYFTTPNLRQSYYNKKLKDHSFVQSDITETCSLIAMVMAINIMDMNPDLRVEYNDNGNTELRNLLILKDLYEISINSGNSYTPNAPRTGTNCTTINNILTQYYNRHGINIETTEKYFYENVRDSLYDFCRVPAVLSIKNYYVENDYQGDVAHSVTVKGEIIYSMSYKRYTSSIDLIGIRVTKDFNVFVISDGWYNSDEDDFGDTLQLLIFEDEAAFAHECSFKEWFDYAQ